MVKLERQHLKSAGALATAVGWPWPVRECGTTARHDVFRDEYFSELLDKALPSVPVAIFG
jgi:hypothetical protein